jgi:hypothetical protein
MDVRGIYSARRRIHDEYTVASSGVISQYILEASKPVLFSSLDAARSKGSSQIMIAKFYDVWHLTRLSQSALLHNLDHKPQPREMDPNLHLSGLNRLYNHFFNSNPYQRPHRRITSPRIIRRNRHQHAR